MQSLSSNNAMYNPAITSPGFLFDRAFYLIGRSPARAKAASAIAPWLRLSGLTVLRLSLERPRI